VIGSDGSAGPAVTPVPWIGRIVAAVCVVAVSACAPGAVLAGQAGPDPPPASSSARQGLAPEEPPVRRDDRRTLRRLPANALSAVGGTVSHANIIPLLAGGAATASGFLVDHEVARAAADPTHWFGATIEDATQPVILGAAAGGLLLVSRAVDAPRVRAVTYDMVVAFAVNEGYTAIVKEVVGRTRPNGEDRRSFPSGHSSTAFALAAVAERHLGWKGGVPAYAVASAIALSRLQRHQHYVSDVLAGGTLGYIVGRTVVRMNDRPPGQQPSSRHLHVAPALTRRAVGVFLSWRP